MKRPVLVVVVVALVLFVIGRSLWVAHEQACDAAFLRGSLHGDTGESPGMQSVLATSFIFFAVANLGAAASADDAPNRSAELQVLDRFVGTWDMSVTVARWW